MVSAMYLIAKHEGIGHKGLFKGIQACWLNSLALSTMILALYEPFKEILAK
jgi:hypothetical protein